MNETLKTIASYENVLLAEMARGRLESEGILAFIHDSQIVGMNWIMSNAVGGVKLAVRIEDEKHARQILSTSVGLELEDCGWGACPNCGSRKLEFRLDRRVSNLLWLFSNFPWVFPRKRYVCNSCGHVTKQPKP
jgi:predicted RNA-binding Zn-ribbon protein involved in translation (DUF1610 family)